MLRKHQIRIHTNIQGLIEGSSITVGDVELFVVLSNYSLGDITDIFKENQNSFVVTFARSCYKKEQNFSPPIICDMGSNINLIMNFSYVEKTIVFPRKPSGEHPSSKIYQLNQVQSLQSQKGNTPATTTFSPQKNTLYVDQLHVPETKNPVDSSSVGLINNDIPQGAIDPQKI